MAPLPYFAYGSNMSSAQMAQRCPGATAQGRARLTGYRLAFDKWSECRGGRVADIVVSAGDELWGVLWMVSEAHLVALDRHEGVARGQYRRTVVGVETLTGDPAQAFAYVICEPAGEGPTTAEYRALLLEGAREHQIPARYLRLLESIAVV